MSEKLEQKTIELMDLATDEGRAFATKLDALAQQYGGQVWDVALWAARVDAAQSLFFGIAWLIVSILLWVWLRPHFEGAAERTTGRDAGEFCRFLARGLIPAVSAFCAIIAVVFMVDLWAWAGLIYPQVWIAKRLLGL